MAPDGGRRRRAQPGDRRTVPPVLLADPDDEAAYAAAVDPMEVAALLETAGVSHDVATTYGHQDVFGLARLVFARVRFRAVAAEPAERPPPGGLRNLGRGLLFAAPTLLLATTQDALARGLAWWSLPVGLTSGWAVSQLVPAIGWPLRGRHVHHSDGVFAALATLAALVLSTGAAWAFLTVAGGRRADVAVAAGIAVYLMASALLLLDDLDVLLAMAVAPGLTVAVAHFARWPVAVAAPVAAWTAVATVVLVTLLAVRHVVQRRWHLPRLSPHEHRTAPLYLLHGASCGLLTSALVVFGHLWRTADHVRATAALPLLLSLGVMEWQLASHRHHALVVRERARDARAFARAARRSFAWRSAVLVMTVGSLSAAAYLAAPARHGDLGLVLVAEAALGIAFYLGLVLVAAGRVGVVLGGWLAAMATMAAAALVEAVLHGTPGAAQGVADSAAGYGVALVLLTGACWKVVASPFSY